MTGPSIHDRSIETLRRLAEVLIPGSDDRPSPADIEDFDGLVARAISAGGQTPDELAAMLAAMPPAIEWDSVRMMSEEHPEHFRLASHLASSAYYMSREVLDALGFPRTRENPAEVSDFVDELETGVFNPVMEAPQRFRDDRA